MRAIIGQSMDRASFRKIKHAARHVVAARWIGQASDAGLKVSLQSLDLGRVEAVDEDELERLAAQIRVNLGDRAVLVFQLQAGLQILIVTDARGGAERLVLHEMVRSVAETCGLLALDGCVDAIDAVYDQLREDSTDRALGARIATLDLTVDRALGIVDSLRHGAVAGLDSDYAQVYRCARLLGELRADDLLTRDDERVATELPYAMKIIGFRGDIPTEVLSAQASTAFWAEVEATLGIAVGGLAEEVHRVAFHLAVCELLAFPGLALRKSLGDLATAIQALGNRALAAEVYSVGRALVGADLTDDTAGDIDLTALEAVHDWLDALLPSQGLDAVVAAQIAVAVDRFSSFVVPLTTATVEQFVQQFPADHRWVATGLLEAIDYRDRAQVRRSIAFLLKGFGVASMPGATLCSLSCTHERGFRGEELTLPRRKLTSALADPQIPTVVIVDDALLDASALIAELQALDESAQSRLRDVKLVLAFALASVHGEATLADYLAECGLMFQILVGEGITRLSPVGWDHRPPILTEAELANPLFSPHRPWWRGRDWLAARTLCLDIGTALVGPRDALGQEGFQDRLVFGHRVPPTTLSLLSRSGTWRERPWIPLFNAPPP